MDIKPIKSRKDYQKALKAIDALFDAKPGTREGDHLDVLATLIEAYEAKHFPIDAPDPIEAIRFVMEQQGLERKDLEPYIGSRARVAEILNHKRALTLPMIRKLNQFLHIPAEILIH
jgi:HTH-type transcriptional regulator / antitoxin HigA